MTRTRPIFGGFGLLWRHQSLLWWIFLVNLALGWMASLGSRAMFGSVLNGSMHSQSLVDRFNLGTFIELLSKPEISFRPLVGGSVGFAMLFFLFMLFLTGGILAVYVEDRKFSWAEFFEQCGGFFWRMVRLVLLGLVVFGIVSAVPAITNSIITKVYDHSPDEKGAFHLRLVVLAVAFVLFLIWRLWFDLAQVRAVRDRERGMFMLTFRTLGKALHHLPRLFWNYFFIMLCGGLVIALLGRTWLNLPHARFGAAWFLLELTVLVSLIMRLWQRATMTLWYEGHAQALEAAAAMAPAPPASMPEPVTISAPVAPAEEQASVTTEPPEPPSPGTSS